MPALAHIHTPEPDATSAHIAAFMDSFSLEAVKVDAEDIAALQSIPARTPVYLTCLPGRPMAGTIERAKRLHAADYEPVPHIAVRNIASAAALDDFLCRAAMLGVRRVLIVGGDRDRPAGPFASAIDVIESGRLQHHGITEIGIAGYPQGHPRIPPLVLDQALAAKIEAAGQTGLAVHIVTQFCFDAVAVMDWIVRLRDRGIEQPVAIGMAGPASLSALLRYARHCGVQASVQGLTRHAGLIKHLVGAYTPDSLIRPLAEAAAAGRLGRAAPHFYSFGGLAAAGRWATAAKAGRIALDRTGGFRVDPE